MSRIEIDAGGRKVTVEHEGELEPLRAAAMKLWESTAGPQPSRGAGFGFVPPERRWTAPTVPIGNGAYGRPPAPVTAEGADRG